VTHFEISQWADMVRGLVIGEELAEMTAHLSSGCRLCRRTVEIFRGVAKSAGWDSRHKVPAYAVQSARAIFALQKPVKIHFFPRIVGQLVYDSFREPLPAGLRSRHRLTRHTLYEAGDYSMDIRMEHLRGMPKVTLVGQIFNRVHPDEPLAILPVYLVSGKEILARACSNNFGEFQFDYEPRSRLSLHIRGRRNLQSHIELPLGRLGGDESSRKGPQTRAGRKKH
jgi:hypothetical protein